MAEPTPRSAVASRLGYAGTLPLLLIAAAMWVVPGWQSWLHPALLAYAALVLSFVGAVHWGLALVDAPPLPQGFAERMFAWSVVPCLVAWVALLAPRPWATLLLVAGMLVQRLQDQRLARVRTLPRWYLRLRTHLSVVFVVCLLAALAAVYIAYGVS